MKKCWLFFCLLCLTGCSHTYLERQIYPICLSIDSTDQGQYQIGLQAPKSSENAEYDLLTATGATLEDALRVLAASTPYPIHFSQIRLCLIGYELGAQTPLRPLLLTLFDLPGMRPNAQVMIAQGSALEVLKAQKPDFGQRLSTHLTILFERMEREETLPMSSLSYCVRELGDGRSDLLLGLCAVNDSLTPKQAQPALAVSWSDQLLPENEIAGLLTRTGPNPVEYVGSACVSSGLVTGMLSAQETQLAVRILSEAKRRVALDAEPLQLQVILPRGSSLAGEEGRIVQLVDKLKALSSDALLFGCAASRAFLTDEQWQAYRFRDRYPHASVVAVCE